MKTALINAFVALIVFCESTATAAQPDSKTQLARSASIAQGLAACSELLWTNPKYFESLHCAVVTKSNSDFDSGLPDRTSKDGLQQAAKRTQFILVHHDKIDPDAVTSDTLIDWMTSPPGLGGIHRPAKSVLNYEQFSEGNLLLYTLDSTKEGRERYTRTIVLPDDLLPMLASSREWRQTNNKLFAPAKALAKDEVESLRSELKSPNVFIRLCTLLRLAELNLATFEDASSTTSSSKVASDSGALILLLLKHRPVWGKDLVELAIALPSDSPTVEGIALGAAINFLAQDETLLKSAITFQAFRDATRELPADLASSLSYPILSAIGDKVKPLNQSLTIDPNTALARLLAHTRSLHQLSTQK